MKAKGALGLFYLLLLSFSPLLLSSCSNDEDYSMSTSAVITSITTDDAAVTAISATTYGTVQNLSAMAPSTYQVGSVYSTSVDPVNGGTRQIGSIDENGKVTAVLSGLSEGTTYYYATFVTLQGKVTKYGDVKSFVATDADVSTANATEVTACSAVLNGQASGPLICRTGSCASMESGSFSAASTGTNSHLRADVAYRKRRCAGIFVY